MGSFETFGGVVVVEAVGQPSRALLVRNDYNQIAFLNNRATSAEVSCAYQCHTFTGAAQDREQVKRITRIKVYGEGVISGGVLTVTADGVRADEYIYSPLSADPLTGALWAQYCLPLRGRTFDLLVQLTGTGLRIRECSLEYVVLN